MGRGLGQGEDCALDWVGERVDAFAERFEQRWAITAVLDEEQERASIAGFDEGFQELKALLVGWEILGKAPRERAPAGHWGAWIALADKARKAPRLGALKAAKLSREVIAGSPDLVHVLIP